MLFGLYQNGPSNSLYMINATTGARTLVGQTGLAPGTLSEGDLAFDQTTGILYGLPQVGTSGFRNLFTINTTTGAATIVAPITGTNAGAFIGDYSGMTFDAAGNLLVLDDANSGLLLTINKTTGVVLSSVALSRTLGVVLGLAFDPTSGSLYVADSSNSTSNLYTLNRTTGVLTVVGPTGLGTADGFTGLTFTPSITAPVPEPSSLALCGVAGLLGLGCARARRERASIS